MAREVIRLAATFSVVTFCPFFLRLGGIAAGLSGSFCYLLLLVLEL
jgi:hypothetical protein